MNESFLLATTRSQSPEISRQVSNSALCATADWRLTAGGLLEVPLCEVLEVALGDLGVGGGDDELVVLNRDCDLVCDVAGLALDLDVLLHVCTSSSISASAPERNGRKRVSLHCSKAGPSKTESAAGPEKSM